MLRGEASCCRIGKPKQSDLVSLSQSYHHSGMCFVSSNGVVERTMRFDVRHASAAIAGNLRQHHELMFQRCIKLLVVNFHGNSPKMFSIWVRHLSPNGHTMNYR